MVGTCLRSLRGQPLPSEAAGSIAMPGDLPGRCPASAGHRASALTELEAPAGALAAVLLPLFDAGITREEAAAAEWGPKLRVRLDEGLRNAVAKRAGLAGDAAAEAPGLDVELAFGLRDS